MKLIIALLSIKGNEKISKYIFLNIINIKNEIKLYNYLKYIYLNLESLKENIQKNKDFIEFLKNYPKESNYFHCKYCFNLIFLIYLIIDELKNNEDKNNDFNKISNFSNINNIILNKDYIIKYIISLIKFKFINCFKIEDNIMKLKFIKNDKCLFVNDDNNNNIIKNNNEKKNKENIIYLEFNLLQHIYNNKLILKYDSIINDLYLIYHISKENQKSSDNAMKELIDNIFEIFKYFWEEIINYFKKKEIKDKKNIFFKLITLRGTETFFRMYLMNDYNSAINILNQIIMLSVDKIKHPFYFNYIDIDENIDKNNKINNEKIKNEITKTIIVEINRINNSEEIITQNREKLLMIIYEIIKNSNKISNEIEKHFIIFITVLYDKNFFGHKFLYKEREEYYNLLEISINILFDIYKMSEYTKQNRDLILKFLILENNKSIFSIIDEKSLKINDKNNNKKKKDISNVLYCIYFLIYFIEKKKYLEYNIKDIGKFDNDNNPIIFINLIISIFFNNIKEIFKQINKKKSNKINNLKSNKINLETYNSLYNYCFSNMKNFFTFEDLEKFYNETKNNLLQNTNSKEFIFKKKTALLKTKNNLDIDNSVENFEKSKEEFIVNIPDNDNNKNNSNSSIIIENYINNKNFDLDNNKSNENRCFHSSIDNFEKIKEKNHNSINNFKEDIGLEKKIQKFNNNENNENVINENKININEEKENININDSKIEEINNDEYKENKINNDDEENKINENKKNNNEDKDSEIIVSSKIVMKNDKIINNTKSSSSFSKSNSIFEEEPNNYSTPLNSTSNLIKINQETFSYKNIINIINIPIIYYQKLINYENLYFTKILANPKVNFIWKIFNYSFRDFIFNNKNFINLSKCFKIFTQKYTLEISSEEEYKYHLNYPTKIKNFICDDYYRPFLKPDMKFFTRELIKISHNYVPKKVLEKIKLNEKFSHIKFIKFFPINKKEKNLKKIFCENVSNKGSIFGKIFLLDSFLVFINSSYKKIKKHPKDYKFFIYSKEDLNKYKKKEKVILIYYKEIKEIILRRFCLKNIGYEIFLKDGRSYLFNFYNLNNIDDFSDSLSKINKDILIVNDLVNYFDKKDYKSKFKKGEINNFQYLLLINKFATRTYNNNSQYPIFPLIYMNIQKNIERKLSKAICLNKEDSEVELNKYILNYDLMQCYFNSHYSTSAYLLYYLVRLIPYTYLQIEFQSGKFDVPERIFSTYNNLSTALLTSSENREIIPEFYHNFEFCINLNYNNIGKMQHTKCLINNFNTNKYKTSVEFIINHRKSFDSLNIAPWINNIFGYNQINTSKEIMNIFPLYSYEQFNDLDKEIQKIKEKLKGKENKYSLLYCEMRTKIAILDLGITPIQLFKASHPEKPGTTHNNSLIDLNSSVKGSSKSLSTILNVLNSSNSSNTNKSKIEKKSDKKKKEEKINELFIPIKDFVSNLKNQKYNMILNNQTMSIFFIYRNSIFILNILNSSKKNINNNEQKINYPIELKLKNNLIQIDSSPSSFSKNICCELMTGFYCICRNENKTIKFINYNEKYYFSYLWLCIITAIEPYVCIIKNDIYDWKLILGDEEGNLMLLNTKFQYFLKNSEIKMMDVQIVRKIKVHKSYVHNILYHERLNIIISSSGNGDISINNACSFETLNIIKIGNNYLINNIKVSFYDLLYISCYNQNNNNYYIKCFTLNGMKI